MASSGSAAWYKYFQGKGNIPTTLKKASPIYDVENPNKRIGEMPAGTPILYLASKSYESKPLVEYRKDLNKIPSVMRVSFDCIAKPGVKASGAVSLKPQSFKVRDKRYSLSEYKTVVMNAIEEHTSLSGQLKTYLTVLFEYYSNDRFGSAQKVSHVYNQLKDYLPINDISKDFGEVLGPVAIALKGVLKSKGFTIPSSAQVYLPARPNEPLMDYAFYDGNKPYIISAKSGTTTNVVKPGDLISLINRDEKKVKKWSKTNQYAILSILADNNILTGPIKAVAYLYPDKFTKKAISKLPLFDVKDYKSFIQDNIYLSTKKTPPTINEIMYECEKMIQAETKTGTLNMNGIFADAIDGIVYYVKFELDSRGIGKWDTASATDIRKPTYGRVFLRTKNGYTRASDRMGIQV